MDLEARPTSSCSQKFLIRHYPESDEYIPHPYTPIFKTHFNVEVHWPTPRFTNGLLPSGFPAEIVYAFCISVWGSLTLLPYYLL
jgi:hypothetical protein